jgi:hypothetical protein
MQTSFAPTYRVPRLLALVGLALLLLAVLAPPAAFAQVLDPPAGMDTSWLQMLLGVGGAPVILALVNLAKPFITDARWYAPLAVVIGVGLNLVLAFIFGLPWLVAIIYGILGGLSAAGLYSGTKTVLNSSA